MLKPSDLKESAELILNEIESAQLLSKVAYTYLTMLRDNPENFIADLPANDIPIPIGVVLSSPGSFPANIDMYYEDGTIGYTHRMYLLNLLYWSSVSFVDSKKNETLWVWLFDILKIKEHYFATLEFDRYCKFPTKLLYERIFSREDILLTMITFVGLETHWQLDENLFKQFTKAKLTNIYKYALIQLAVNGRIMDVTAVGRAYLAMPRLQDPNPNEDPDVDERFIIEVINNYAIPDPPPPEDAQICMTCFRLGTDYCIKEKQALLKESGVEFNPDMEDVFEELDKILNET